MGRGFESRLLKNKRGLKGGGPSNKQEGSHKQLEDILLPPNYQ